MFLVAYPLFPCIFEGGHQCYCIFTKAPVCLLLCHEAFDQGSLVQLLLFIVEAKLSVNCSQSYKDSVNINYYVSITMTGKYNSRDVIYDRHFTLGCHLQCDQMARLLLQYLALYKNELLPKNIKSCQSRFTILPKWPNLVILVICFTLSWAFITPILST